jgi:hypothetical protein
MLDDQMELHARNYLDRRGLGLKTRWILGQTSRGIPEMTELNKSKQKQSGWVMASFYMVSQLRCGRVSRARQAPSPMQKAPLPTRLVDSEQRSLPPIILMQAG